MSFTDPKQQKAGEADSKSIRLCSAHIDALNMASHALQSNLAVLEAMQLEAEKRRSWASSIIDPDCDTFQGGIADIIRETQATDAHLKIIRQRLERTIAMVSIASDPK